MLDPYYLIVDSFAWLLRLLPLGVKTVQLRIKNQPTDEIIRQTQQAMALCAQHGATLILNDYWQTAIDLGCDFVHLGQEDLAEADLAALRRATVRIGVSTHTPEELETALRARPDYVALGPIWPTLLKVMKYPPQGLARIGQWKKQIQAIPLVAIGGLTPDRAPLVLQAGADSACVVTDVLTHADPESRSKEWLRATEPFRKKT
ncbi:MAG TPA: thiamine phosphate synthase [Pseudomonadota bacterium]|nr:thiamine phosphate synthase [Pseudomonadota bacterium]HNF99409.1 thiamine phosphate synthase [Pseudomonadota bacterium]